MGKVLETIDKKQKFIHPVFALVILGFFVVSFILDSVPLLLGASAFLIIYLSAAFALNLHMLFRNPRGLDSPQVAQSMQSMLFITTM